MSDIELALISEELTKLTKAISKTRLNLITYLDSATALNTQLQGLVRINSEFPNIIINSEEIRLLLSQAIERSNFLIKEIEKFDAIDLDLVSKNIKQTKDNIDLHEGVELFFIKKNLDKKITRLQKMVHEIRDVHSALKSFTSLYSDTLKLIQPKAPR